MGDQDRNRLVIKSEAKRLVYAEVYAPMHVDTDGEFMTEEHIERMAHKFLSSGKVTKIDVQHDQKESGCVIVESFLAREQDPDGFIKGSWVLGVKVIPDELWERVQKGELNGFSFQGYIHKTPVKATVVVARKFIGETEESAVGVLPPHRHTVSLSFTEAGRLMAGRTSREFDHDHGVKRATATEMEWEHAHRMILID